MFPDTALGDSVLKRCDRVTATISKANVSIIKVRLNNWVCVLCGYRIANSLRIIELNLNTINAVQCRG